MLILTRKAGQSLVLGDDVVVTVLEVDGDRVKLGIAAPQSVRILRQELCEAVREANLAAKRSPNDLGLSALLEPLRQAQESGRPGSAS